MSDMPSPPPGTLDKIYAPDTCAQRWQEDLTAPAPSEPGSTKPPFCLIMPPPNVTGSLHLGHALTFTLQDVWGRFWKARGGDVWMQPGLDHAGIATQMVVERQLASSGQTRHDLGKEAFQKKVWAWKEESGGTILSQLARLGVSAQWGHTHFTLDAPVVAAVRKVFCDLWKDGLIAKDKRLVNWDTKLKTALSDLEVVTKEVPGSLWRIRYPLVSEAGKPDGFIDVATTRPETLFGDQSVAVHPEDLRYQTLVGRRAHLPLTDRTIPVVADDRVTQDKGTGAVKITPAHDFNDFEMGRTHGLAMLTILDESGRLNGDVPPPYQGLDRFVARTKVLEDLTAQGLLMDTTSIVHGVPHGDRSDTVLEPRLTDQWYLNAAVLAAPALKAYEDGRLRFVPEGYGEVYANWLRNIQPWCLSRQLWWGHAIPAWYGPDGHVFVSESEEIAQTEAQAHYGSEVSLTPDPDVLDTWFSSGLWPFVTLGWPEKTPALSRFYPSDVLVTGFDIIFFWVARMVMMGIHFMGDVPFREVSIHGLVRDSSRQKMSKSKGNVVDPLELLESHGADALRLSLTSLASPGRDIAFDPGHVTSSRNFITKLWNAARFALMKGIRIEDSLPASLSTATNQWIVDETAFLVHKATAAFEAYKFYEATSLIYHFVWGTYCDWYLELIKGDLECQASPALAAETRAVAGWVLSVSLRLLHPVAPFVTSELWSALSGIGTLAQAPWPLLKPLAHKGEALDAALFAPYQFPEAQAQIRWLIQFMGAVRSVRSASTLPPGPRVPLEIDGASASDQALLTLYQETVQRILKLSGLTFLPHLPAGGLLGVLGALTFRIPLEEDPALERAKQEKALAKLEAELAPLQARLASPDFMGKASPEVVEKAQARLALLETERSKMTEMLR